MFMGDNRGFMGDNRRFLGDDRGFMGDNRGFVGDSREFQIATESSWLPVTPAFQLIRRSQFIFRAKIPKSGGHVFVTS